ncbi:MAG: SDR family oxidoreductase [Mycobacterium leprae]
MSTQMAGKTCIVTGATSGIGRETALGLARMGAHVALVARDRNRGEATVAAITEQTGNRQVDLLLADLSDQSQVRRLAAEILAKYERIDVLVNNAGLVLKDRQITVDGLERTFAVNHLASFLLTNLLLDRLKASSPARIVNTASEAARIARIDFADLHGERRYAAFRAYGQSKLANILFTYELARRLKGTGVTANCLHPGVVSTGFGVNNQGFWRFAMKLGQPFMISAAQGADTILYLAAAPEVEGITGQYFAKRRPIKSNAESYNEEVARRLWAVSEQLTGLAH